jgi:hypothetical protein
MAQLASTLPLAVLVVRLCRTANVAVLNRFLSNFRKDPKVVARLAFTALASTAPHRPVLHPQQSQAPCLFPPQFPPLQLHQHLFCQLHLQSLFQTARIQVHRAALLRVPLQQAPASPVCQLAAARRARLQVAAMGASIALLLAQLLFPRPRLEVQLALL